MEFSVNNIYQNLRAQGTLSDCFRINFETRFVQVIFCKPPKKSYHENTDTVIVRLRSGEVGCLSWHTRYLKFCSLSHTILCSLGPPFLTFNVEEIWSVTQISGNATDPSHNTDIISSAFWLVSGTEFNIMRSDDPQHTALLKTTNLCLAGLRRLGRKSQTIVTSETVSFCPEINVWDDTM